MTTTNEKPVPSIALNRLSVDSGQMAVIPAGLFVRGSYDDLDTAMDTVAINGGVCIAGGLGIAFRLETTVNVYLAVDLDFDPWPRVTALRVQTEHTGLRNVIGRIMLPPGVYVLADPAYTVQTPERATFNQIAEATMVGFTAGKVIAYHHGAAGKINDMPYMVVSSFGGDGVFPAKVYLSGGPDRSFRSDFGLTGHNLRILVEFI